jgi:predicted nucleotide-binding protein
MTLKYLGTYKALQNLIERAGIAGDWSDKPGGLRSFRASAGGIVNWWPSTGTIQFQGPAEGKATLKQAVFPEEPGPNAPATSPLAPHQIFIVHGHDIDARDQMELTLHRLNLEPYVLMNTSGAGLTIIEALEGKIGRDYSSDFGIVLLTPDDIGYAKKDGPGRAEPRARQNVVLETGMLLASLTRGRMAMVVKGHVELPSDLQGIIQFRYNDHIREIVPKLCQRLREAGFDVDPSQIASAAQ